MVKMVRQHRLVTFGRPRTPWRFDKQTVIQEAIEMGVASYDARYDETFFDVFCQIESRHVAADQVIVKLEARVA